MNPPLRLVVPDCCDAKATTVAPNGYRTCDRHRPDVREIMLPGPGGWFLHYILPSEPMQPCDYPMDGLGAARLHPSRWTQSQG